MRRVLTLALVTLFLVGCGRSQLGPADSGPMPDGDTEPPPRCASDDDCDDGDPCNGVESCVDELCEPGEPVLCDDGVDCTADTCDSATGGCVSLPDHERCERGELCDPEEGCVRRACTSSEDCDDGAFCNGVEFCSGGFCAGGEPPDCDDGLGCTVDRCDEASGGCVSTANDALCDDGRYCNGVETCDPALGCRPGRAVPCDDGDPCTTDSCDEATRSCVHAPGDADRDGYVDCACAPAPCDCDDGDITVNPGMTEQCRDLRDNDCNGLVDCDDRAACASDPRCGTTECTSDGECSDGVFCNGEELCRSGRCVPGVAPDCGDSVRCTVDLCDPVTDACAHDPDHAMCRPGELCDPVAGCVRRPCGSDAECDDGLYCNGSERCSSAGTCVAGTAVSCVDPVDCTVDRCDEASDRCVSVPDDGLCDDRRFCNGEERCDPAAGCVDGPDPCGVSDPCETVLCDEASMSCGVTMRDDDRDGFPPLECGGGDCDDRNRLVNPAAAEVCDDGVDNDCDGPVDCADTASCSGDPACCVPTGPEACDDHVDNDCDGATDCSDVDSCAADPICTGCVPEVCWDGRDNDCDALVDCADSDCDWYPPCAYPTYEVDCANGVDDDLDSLVDCNDPDCDGSPFCPWPDTCTDAVDVTGLGVVAGSTTLLADDYRPDTSTPGCAGGRGPDAVYFIELTTAAVVHMDTFGSDYDTVLYVRERHCTSGVQVACNDDTSGLDSSVDFVADPGFYFIFVDGYGTSSSGNYELHIEVTPLGAEDCGNGFDDDGDGLVDCDDTDDCGGDPRCAPVPEMGVAACTDGRDNDGDGLVDCDDTDDCAVVSFIGECCNGVDDNGNGVVDEFACSCDAANPCDEGVCYGGSIGACGPRCTTLGGDRFCRLVFPGTTCSSASGACE